MIANLVKLGECVRNRRGEMSYAEAAKDFAKLTGRTVDDTTLYLYEKGKRAPNMQLLGYVCKWLGMTPNDFYE